MSLVLETGRDFHAAYLASIGVLNAADEKLELGLSVERSHCECLRGGENAVARLNAIAWSCQQAVIQTTQRIIVDKGLRSGRKEAVLSFS